MQMGHSYADVSDHLQSTGNDPPERQSLADIWGNDAMKNPGRDAINEGAGPIGEALLGVAAGGIVGLAKGAAEGIAKGVLTDTSGDAAGLFGRAVTPATDGTLAPRIARLSALAAENNAPMETSGLFQRLLPAAKDGADDMAGWIHGSDTALSPDMMRAGKSMWLTKNPGVAKNVGSILHDVELRPGAVEDVTSKLTGADGLSQQRSLSDLVSKYQFDNPTNVRYLDANIKDTGPVRVMLNQRRDVLDISRRK
jgi:hypothetical protein